MPRTFSKLYGMAGLRLGYPIGHPETIMALRRHKLANSVNALVALPMTHARISIGTMEEMRSAIEGFRTVLASS